MLKKLLLKTNVFYVLAVVIFSFGVNFYYSNIGVNPMDNFVLYNGGYRILNGYVPFKDYWLVTGPLLDYLNAFFFLILGISWKSFKNRYASEKSLSLKDFENIFEIKNSIIFNLQYGDIKEELNHFTKKRNYKIVTLENLDLFNNFSGLANLLKNLDLFVTVSNSTAHLASALGVRTILIKPENHASFHYWNYEDGKTPWYKSVNIISRENLKDKSFVSKLFKL